MAFTDIGEYDINNIYNDQIVPNFAFGELPDNSTNNLFEIVNDTARLRNINNVYLYLESLDFTSGEDFDKIE